MATATENQAKKYRCEISMESKNNPFSTKVKRNHTHNSRRTPPRARMRQCSHHHGQGVCRNEDQRLLQGEGVRGRIVAHHRRTPVHHVPEPTAGGRLGAVRPPERLRALRPRATGAAAAPCAGSPSPCVKMPRT